MGGRLDLIIRLPDGTVRQGHMGPPPAGSVEGPLVSCLMVTRGDRPAVRHAIECYRRQSYRYRELVIVCARADNNVGPILAELNDPSIRLVIAALGTLGELRNRSVAEARGELLCTWDDDDLSHPHRIELQMVPLTLPDVDATFLLRCALWWPARSLLGLSSRRPWEPSMLARREAIGPYPAIDMGEDAEQMALLKRRHGIAAIDAPHAYCYVIHGANTYGQEHFELLLANATARLEGEIYDRVMEGLAHYMPIRDYPSPDGEAVAA